MKKMKKMKVVNDPDKEIVKMNERKETDSIKYYTHKPHLYVYTYVYVYVHVQWLDAK